MVEILKNVPIPARYGVKSELALTFKKMQVGHCVDLENISNTAVIYYAAKQAGIKITLRRQENNVVRVWRVKP